MIKTQLDTAAILENLNSKVDLCIQRANKIKATG